MWRPITIPICAWLCLLATALAEKLEVLEEAFDATILRAQIDYDRSNLQLDEGFAAHLARLMTAQRSAGELESTLAIKQEIERFSEEKNLSSSDLVERPLDLLEAQQKYLKTLAIHDITLIEKKSRAYDIYIPRLEALKVELTIAGKIDEAERAAGKQRSAIAARRALRELVEATKRLPIPDGAIEWQGHHYLVVVEPKVSFADARVASRKLGGHLVFLSTEDERKFIHKLKGRKTAWIGASDEDEEGAYTWLDGSAISKELRNVIPQSNSRVNDCGMLTVDGVLGTRTNAGHHKSGVEKWVNRYVIEWDYQRNGGLQP